MQDLIVTLVQESIVWQNPVANREKFAALLRAHGPGSDLIVLPETFTTGFGKESAVRAEPMDGPTLHWLLQQSLQLNAHICGSYVVREDGQVFNRLVWVKPDGNFVTYDKRHLFSFAGEDAVYSAGSERVIVDCNGWRCCPQICYDLRFPVWSRNRDDYDLLVYVANWPEARVNHWTQLLVARAIENLSYAVGVNRIGDDGNGYGHNGQSVALDPKGNPLLQAGRQPGCFRARLDYEELQRYRQKFGALADRDDFVIRP